MRVIKFRGLDRNDGLVKIIERIDFKNELVLFVGEQGWVDFSNVEIMQFTGLHDKNGVEIYTGDKVVIEKEDDEEIFIVKWDNNTARFIMESETYILDFDNYDGADCEKIGNIHEGSEDNDK